MSAKRRSPEERLFGAAVLKRSFQLKGDESSPTFRYVYEGVLRDLGISDDEVDRYIEAHRDAVDQAARGTLTAGGRSTQ